MTAARARIMRAGSETSLGAYSSLGMLSSVAVAAEAEGAVHHARHQEPARTHVAPPARAEERAGASVAEPALPPASEAQLAAFSFCVTQFDELGKEYDTLTAHADKIGWAVRADGRDDYVVGDIDVIGENMKAIGQAIEVILLSLPESDFAAFLEERFPIVDAGRIALSQWGSRPKRQRDAFIAKFKSLRDELIAQGEEDGDGGGGGGGGGGM
jgi:hypothetical protein